MSESDWKLLVVVHSLDEVETIAKSNGVCQYRTHNLANSTKYSFKCSQYRKYPIFIYELKATVPDDDPNSITIMFTTMNIEMIQLVYHLQYDNQ